ncbi:MAG TPA: histidine kinase [Gammaproteobacteria bacterium]|nr:histidine kinase [Gammaproteobacteria bacterium]
MLDKTTQQQDFFLPNFCTPRNTLIVVVIAELVALLLALGRSEFQPGIWTDVWGRLAIVSLFLQWLALSCAAILCLLRRYLARLSERLAITLTLLALIVSTAALSEAAWQVAQLSGAAAQALFPLNHAGFILRNAIIALIVSVLVLRYFYVQHQWQDNVRREASARIAALQARIRPHFLFNSMNTIAALIRTAPAAAEQAVEDLADLFRASLAEPDKLATLQDELQLTRMYARLEELRLGERLTIDWDLDALPADALLPPLTLQPLLENAVYHGIEPAAAGGTVALRGGIIAKSPEKLWLQVTNPLPPVGSRTRSGNRLALDNIRQRLLLAFGEQGELHITTQDHSFCVTLHWPLVDKTP